MTTTIAPRFLPSPVAVKFAAKSKPLPQATTGPQPTEAAAQAKDLSPSHVLDMALINQLIQTKLGQKTYLEGHREGSPKVVSVSRLDDKSVKIEIDFSMMDAYQLYFSQPSPDQAYQYTGELYTSGSDYLNMDAKDFQAAQRFIQSASRAQWQSQYREPTIDDLYRI